MNIVTEQEIHDAYDALSKATTNVHKIQEHLIAVQDNLDEANYDTVHKRYKGTKEEHLSLINTILNEREDTEKEKRESEFVLAKAHVEVDRIRSLLLFIQKGEIQ